MNRRVFFLPFCAAAAGLMSATWLLGQTAAGAENPNEATALEYDATNKTWRFKWWGRTGRTYFIQRSADLAVWSWAPIIKSGDNSAQEWRFTSNAGRSFVRLLYTDIPSSDPENDDFDGDGAPNLFEIMNGFGPFGRTDANNNPMPDEWELYHAGKFAIWTPGLSAGLPRNQTTNNTIYLRNDTASPVTYAVALADNFGPSYRYEDSVTGNISHSWEEISVTGTRLETVSTQLDAWEPVELTGFAFPFYGRSFARINISTKGMLTLGEAGSFQWVNYPLPSTSSPANIIAGFWDDLDPRARGDVYYREEPDRFIVQYDNVGNFADPAGSAYTFQIVLFVDGRIQFRYKSMAGILASATTGIQDSNRAAGLQIAYATAYAGNEMAVEINPRSSFLNVNPANGIVPAKSTLALDAIFNSWQFPPGTYTAAITTSHDAAGVASPHTSAASMVVFNTPATVEVTAPATGTEVLQGDSLALSAAAIDPDGMQKVEFHDGSTKIAETGSAPYTATWNNPPVGVRTITASAIDMFGGRTTSAPVTVTVLADADGDWMPDSWETAHFGDLAQGAHGDYDGDGYSNGEEFELGKNPNLADDTDGDGIPDGREQFLIYRTPYGGWGYFDPGNPDTDGNGIPDGQEDYDKDGLTVLGEVALGTDPNLTDTDGDAMNDGMESALGTSPLVPDPWATRDSDGDGLSDLFEGRFGSNPFNPDTNGNGMNDGEELDRGGNPRASGPPPAPLPPPSPDPEPPGDPAPLPPDPVAPGDYDILVEAKSVSFPKYGHATFQVLDPPKRFLEMFSQQSFTGGCPESGPLGVSGSKTVSIDAGTGQTTTTGDEFYASGSTVQSPVRLGGTFGIDGYDDPPNQEADCPGTVTYSTTLSGENTTGMMIAAGKAKLEAFGDDFQPGTPSAYRNVHDNELCFDYQKVQFKFRWKAGVVDGQRRRITHLLVFRPEDDADTANIDESVENAEVLQTIAWNGQSEASPVFTIDPDQRKYGVDGTYSLIQAGIEVDWNRDGRIDGADRGRVSEANPWRFWVNDDDDSGPADGHDMPGRTINKADYNNAVVDSVRDLVDFFPVFLDIEQLLGALPHSAAGITYKLKQAEGALNFVYTNKTKREVFDYQKQILATGFGPDFSQAAGEATAEQITAAGVTLNAAFLDLIKNNEGGVILLEGRVASTSPLRLVVERDGVEIAGVAVNSRISLVEEMFRHVNLTSVPKNYDGSAPGVPEAPEASRTGEPASYPDSLTNGKYFVFLHGYNVDAQTARGWQAEVFKRLHVLGSKARFIGVTWHGATGLDYHRAVFHAFQTGDALADALSFTGNADLTIAGHSLGNMVVSHAIQSGGLTPARYYMINAATPLEAYALGDVGPNESANMTELAWRTYDVRLFTANWHALFEGTSDNRKNLTWKNLFAGVRTRSETHNFYSEEDDVVTDADSNTSASIMTMLLNQGFDVSTGAWKAQELVKGVDWTTSLASAFMIRGQAGWGFNLDDWYTVTNLPGPPGQGGVPLKHRLEPGETSLITNEEMKTKPFFDRFIELDLMNATASTASSKAGEDLVRYDLLARGIPAMSNAVAANFMTSMEPRNYPMHTDGKASSNGLFPTPGNKWRHSDFKVVALPYVYPMYEEMIIRGSLK